MKGLEGTLRRLGVAGAVGAVMLSIRLAHQSRDEVWIASGAGAGLSAMMRAGALGLTLALAATLPLALPASSQSVFGSGPERQANSFIAGDQSDDTGQAAGAAGKPLNGPLVWLAGYL